ncbi:MAG: hypothetical protein JWM34_1392 [Ilumatobacteraceae bacterium]|nr:hypothetical protein [Ilumatobacteraceae bacterium]
MNKPRIILAAVTAGTFVLASCSAGSTDYKAAAEKAIKGSSGLGEGSSATCDKPDSTDVGTTFSCSGTDSAGTAYSFIATIDKKNHVTVNQDTSGGAGTADTTVAGGSTVDTTATSDTTAVSTATS